MFKLRPHHVLCIGFYKGKGYSESFVKKMDSITASLAQNPSQNVRITASDDDLCAACPHFDGKLCASIKKVSRYDAAVMRLCGLEEGVYPYDFLRALADEKINAEGKLCEVCSDCEWYYICGENRIN